MSDRLKNLDERALAGRLGMIALLWTLAACNRGAAAQSESKGVESGENARRPATAVIAGKEIWRARRVPQPDSIRALYVNGWAAGSRTRMRELIRIADETEINAFVVDMKESDTYLTYTGSGIPLVREIGADRRPASTWIPQLLDTLHAHGIYAIARIVVFKDRMLAEKKSELAIRHVNGGVWRDSKGVAWVNPYDRRVWDYNIAIAREALEMGFSELQWDYVRFPDVTARLRTAMSFPGSNNVSQADNIRNFILYSKDRLREFEAPVTADVFGLVTHLDDDVGIGQNWEKIISAADAVLPMTYPSHYDAGLYGMPRPHAKPYEVVRLAMTDAVERTEWLRDSAKVPVGEVRTWLEAMSIRGLRYGPNELRRQIQGAYDAGVTSWALWNPGSRYREFEPALRPGDGGLSPLERGGWDLPRWTVPRQQLSKIIQRRERARADSISNPQRRPTRDSPASRHAQPAR